MSQESSSTGGTTSSTSYSAESSSYSTNSNTSEYAPNSSTPSGAGHLSMWALIVAAVATALAVGAVVKGLRRAEPHPHALQGSVARRMGLFSQFADCALCTDGTSGRPSRVVELTASADDYERMPTMAVV